MKIPPTEAKFFFNANGLMGRYDEASTGFHFFFFFLELYKRAFDLQIGAFTKDDKKNIRQ
jgi:hypothetical protein